MCSEGSTCSCDAVKPGVEVGSSNPVVSCATYGCCLLTERETELSFASCECFNTDVSCEAEAATRRDVSVVERCPPGSALPPCAAAGENCRPEYLGQNDLAGRCAGLLCRPNEAGVPTCQPGTAEELALATECDSVARSTTGRNELEVLTPSLRTSVGELDVGEVLFAFAGTGPGGCLNDLQITFGDFGCSFELAVELSGGALTPSSFLAHIPDCPGFVGETNQDYLSPDLSPGDPLPFSFSFEGIACDANLVFESYCVAGNFDFHFGGTLRGVTFEDQHLVVRGVMCGLDPSGACPER